MKNICKNKSSNEFVFQYKTNALNERNIEFIPEIEKTNSNNHFYMTHIKSLIQTALNDFLSKTNDTFIFDNCEDDVAKVRNYKLSIIKYFCIENKIGKNKFYVFKKRYLFMVFVLPELLPMIYFLDNCIKSKKMNVNLKQKETDLIYKTLNENLSNLSKKYKSTLIFLDHFTSLKKDKTITQHQIALFFNKSLENDLFEYRRSMACFLEKTCFFHDCVPLYYHFITASEIYKIGKEKDLRFVPALFFSCFFNQEVINITTLGNCNCFFDPEYELFIEKRQRYNLDNLPIIKKECLYSKTEIFDSIKLSFTTFFNSFMDGYSGMFTDIHTIEDYREMLGFLSYITFGNKSKINGEVYYDAKLSIIDYFEELYAKFIKKILVYFLKTNPTDASNTFYIL